jgi:hypothetical protein
MKEYNAIQNVSIPDWDRAEALTDFCSPWTHDAVPPMTFRALWNAEAFMFRFEVVDNGIRIFTATNHKMEVVHSDRVEIFFRSNKKMDPYYCLEMDPLGRVLDYKTVFYRKFEYGWQWPGNGSLNVRSGLLPSGYWVEGAIRLDSLRSLHLLKDGVLEAGLFRGKCLKPPPDATFNWISWVRPDSQHPDFHIPAAFGSIILAG